MRTVYLSITSHHDDDEIMKYYSDFPKQTEKYTFKLNIMDNTNSDTLKEFCDSQGYFYYADEDQRGYGENNNKMFEILNPDDEDIFIVCNPDIKIFHDQIDGIIDDFIESNPGMMGVKVYEDDALTVHGYHNRKIPCLLDPIISFATHNKRFARDPNKLEDTGWIGGAFMIFKAEMYRAIHGFDERFFMYYEDVDICLRVTKHGRNVRYNPNFYIVHHAKRAGRSFLTRAFFWNMTSMIKFFFIHRITCIISNEKKHDPT